MTIDIPEGYESLGLALGEAVAQASRGKGADRHAEKGEPFSDQLIMSIPKRLGPGGECFCLGQALKKICESRRLPPGRARAELLGAINYAAAAWSLLGGAESVFSPEDREMPLFPERTPVECRPPLEPEWTPALYIGVDPAGFHIVERGGTRMHLSADAVRKPEAPKAAGNVCLGFAERVVSLMKEAGVREVSFASPGACIRADGTVTGLRFTTEDSDAPRTKEELVRRIRDCNPSVYVPEDADAPRFRKGELVEYRGRDGKWKPASFMHMDGGYAVLVSGGEKVEVPAFDVRPAEKV